MNKKTKSANLIAIVIGFISICIGVYNLLRGDEFNSYFFPLFLGISLVGTGLINNNDYEAE